MSWKDLRVRTKIMICSIISLIMMGVIGFWTYQASTIIFKNAEQLRDESIVFAVVAEQMGKDVIRIQQWLADISATRGLDGLDEGFDEAEKSYRSFLSGLERFEKMSESEHAGEHEGEEFDRTAELKALKTHIDEYYDMGKKMAKGYIEGGPEVGNKMVKDFEEAAEAIGSAMEPFIEQQVSGMDTLLEDIISSIDNLKTEVLTVFLISIALVILSGLLLTRSVTGPLDKVMGLTRSLAEGDLTKQINLTRKDEFGQLLAAEQSMIGNLKRIVGQITGVASTVASSSEELSATTEQINSGISEQSNQLEQSSAATTEVSQTIMEVARSAADASGSAKESVGIANDGKSVVEQTVSSMMKISENVEASSMTIGELGESSKKIGDIIDVINDIASQTNLLALNAAIEAARAGEQGRGFAVVADEVRKLAEKTSQATDEITGMINKIQGDTDVSVKSMEKNRVEAEEGVKLAGQAKESLDKIVNASERCLDQVNSIAAASEQQSAAVEEVSSNVENIANNFGTSRDAVAQISQSTVELSQISNELMNLISWFKTDSNSRNSVAADYTGQIANEYKTSEVVAE